MEVREQLEFVSFCDLGLRYPTQVTCLVKGVSPVCLCRVHAGVPAEAKRTSDPVELLCGWQKWNPCRAYLQQTRLRLGLALASYKSTGVATACAFIQRCFPQWPYGAPPALLEDFSAVPAEPLLCDRLDSWLVPLVPSMLCVL